MPHVQVRLFAAARAAAHTEELQVPIGSIAEILAFCATDNSELQRILPQCTILIDGIASHDHQVLVTSGSQLDVLPKFAGG
jgi:molybdopterin synthase sulfur carrier subunit